MRRLSVTPANLAGVSLCVVWLFHTTLVDRLDITKLAVGLVTASAALVLVHLRQAKAIADEQRAVSFTGLALFGVCLAVGSVFSWEFVAARVEGWAPWLVAVVLFVVMRAGVDRRVGGIIAFAAAVLVFIGLVQAFGGDWFIGQMNTFKSRPVMGTLGNPGLYGVCLAGAVPFVLVRARRLHFAILSLLIVAAVVLSGARTAWVMLIPAVVVGLLSLPVMRVASILGAGIILASVIGLGGPEVRLEERVADLGDSAGGAAGRLYLWKVNWDLVQETGPVGGGPETFKRRWPWAQAAFLAEHPEDIHFHSDIRHAHADVAEILVDWGWLGLMVAAVMMFRLLFSRSPRAREDRDVEEGAATDARLLERRAAKACILALLLGGLAFPILFQPPSLFLAALAVGVLAPAPKKRPFPLARVAAIVGILLTFFWVGQRTVSEVFRNFGLRAEVAGNLAEARSDYCLAADLDSRNPLALVLCARSLIVVDPETALRLADEASIHLPTAPVYAVRAAAASSAGEDEIAAESWSIALSLRPSAR